MTSHSDKFGLNGLVNGELIKLSRASRLKEKLDSIREN